MNVVGSRREVNGIGAVRANVMTRAGAAKRSVRPAVFPQEILAAFGDRDAHAEAGDRLARDIAAIDRVFPDRQPRA